MADLQVGSLVKLAQPKLPFRFALCSALPLRPPTFSFHPYRQSSAGGAAEVSPPRKGWEREEENASTVGATEPLIFSHAYSKTAHPNTNFGSYATPCFFNNATNSSAKFIFL